MPRPLTLVSIPVETRSASPEQRLAARVLGVAVEDARRGDPGAQAFVSTPSQLRLWAELLHVKPERLVTLAAAAMPRT